MSGAIDPGPTPELAWLPVDRLRVDHSYQRTIESERSQALIKRIAAGFRWIAFQAVLATPSAEEGAPIWLVLDGQHRVEAARRAGILHVPAVVVAAADRAEQATAFVRANLDRVVINQYAIHHARVVAGEEWALNVDRVCRAARLSIPKYAMQAAWLKPGETLALGTIGRIIGELGVPAATGVLRAIAEAWRDNPGHLRASLFKACAALVKETPIPGRQALYRQMTAALRASKPDAFFARASHFRYERGAAEWRSLSEILKADLALAARFDDAPRAGSFIAPVTREMAMGRR